MDYAVLHLGMTESGIMLRDGTIKKKTSLNEGDEKLSIHTVVARIKALSQQEMVFFAEHCLPASRANKTWQDLKNDTQTVSAAIDAASLSASTLKNRLITKRSILEERLQRCESPIDLFRNLYRMIQVSAYTRLINDLDIAERNLQGIVKPLPPLRKYRSIEDCKALLKANGFEESQITTDLAAFLQEKQFSLKEEHVIESEEEKATFNAHVVEFLEERYKEAYVVVRHSLRFGASEDLHYQGAAKGPYLSGRSLIDGPSFQRALETLLHVHHIRSTNEADILLREKRFDTYVSQKDIASFRAYVAEQGLYLETGFTVVTTTDQFLLDDLVQRYFQDQHGTYVYPHHVDGKKFAEMHVHRYTEEPITKERAELLLENLGYEPSEEFVRFLVTNNFSMANFAHLQTNEETQAFNKLAVEFLTSLANEQEVHTERLNRLSQSEGVLSPTDFKEALLSFRQEPVDRQKATLLLLNLGLHETSRFANKLRDWLVQHGLSINPKGALMEDNIPLFNNLFLTFLQKEFPDKELFIMNLLEMQRYNRSTTVPVQEIMQKCKAAETPLNQERIRALLNELSVPENLLEEVLAFVCDSSFQLQSEEEFSSLEKEEITLIVLNYFKKKFPNTPSIHASLEKHFASGEPISFTDVWLQACYPTEEGAPVIEVPLTPTPPPRKKVPKRTPSLREKVESAARTLLVPTQHPLLSEEPKPSVITRLFKIRSVQSSS